jgi:hypothetical protein
MEELMENQLLDLYKRLLTILVKHREPEIEYVINKVSAIIVFLEENRDSVKSEDLKKISKVHRTFYPPRGGLSDFFIWREDYKERVKANDELDQIKNKLYDLVEYCEK